MIGFTLSQVLRNPKINQMNSLQENKKVNDYIDSFAFKESKYLSDNQLQSEIAYYGLNFKQMEKESFFMLGAGKHTGVGIYNKK